MKLSYNGDDWEKVICALGKSMKRDPGYSV